MKKFFEKHDLFKMAMIVLLLAVVFSWIMPYSYFNNGLFVQEDNIFSTVNIGTYDDIDSNLKKNMFKILGGSSNGNVGLRNVMFIIDTNEYDNPNMILEKKSNIDSVHVSFGFQGENNEKNFNSVVPAKYIKEAIIKDPYLGDLIIPNPNYYKRNTMNANDLYNDEIREVDYLYSNCILKKSIKMFTDLMRELINKVDLLKIPNLYKRKILEYANNKLVELKNELLHNKTI